MKTKRAAVLLAGAGNMDGNNVIEAIALLHALAKHVGEYVCFAPNIEQHDVINHLTSTDMHERRWVLPEAGRLVQGHIKDLDEFDPDDFGAICFPGGLGVIKSFCTYAMAGQKCTVNAQVEKAIRNMHQRKSPILALCIAPVLIARVLGDVTITLGGDCPPAQDCRAWGSHVQTTAANEFTIDRTNGVYTSPCYMLENDIITVFDTVDRLVQEMVKAM